MQAAKQRFLCLSGVPRPEGMEAICGRYPDEIPPHIKVLTLLDKGGYPGVQP